ncbi:MAG: hypothetical protein IPM91_07295 [Bacteroidetes bacterium]|nr:hypothetical protein [Bacteroidota bacterium]
MYEPKINDIEDISIEIRIFNRTGKLMFSGKGRSDSLGREDWKDKM